MSGRGVFWLRAAFRVLELAMLAGAILALVSLQVGGNMEAP